jgi:DNA-binding NtrC family response regulator
MHFLKEKSSEEKIIDHGINPELMDFLKNYEWPGNIRELENVVERLIALSPKGNFNIGMLPTHICNPKEPQLISDDQHITPSMEEIEKAYIHWVLTQSGGQKQKVAEILGIGRSTLDRKIEKYGLENKN